MLSRMMKLLVAGGIASVSLFAGAADAACRQQFSHTTCLPFWQGGTCTNHFKNVCDAPPPRIDARLAPQVNQNRPVIQPNVGGRIIGDAGASLSSNKGAGLVSDLGSAFRR
jgi:hypothetical protein